MVQHLVSDRVANIRALSSLTHRDGSAVRATVRATGGHYVVQEHDDYDGYLSFMVTARADETSGFLVSGRTGAIDLARLQGDAMVPLGRFPSIAPLLLTLRPALAAEPGGPGRATAQRLIDRHGSDAALHAALHADAAPGAGWQDVIRAIDQEPEIG